MTQETRPESAAVHVVTRVPKAQPGDSVRQVIDALAGHAFDALEAVYVVDPDGRLLGAVRLPALMQAPATQALREIIDVDYPRVSSHDDQEHVAAEALRRGASSVAVVDDQGRLTGAVLAIALLDILRIEHVEDLHRIAGIARENTQSRDALESPPTRRARHRLPWLIVGLIGSMFSAVIVARFEEVLARKLTVAFFVPAIVYLADAIGTQTEAIAVRGLSLSRLSLRHLLFDELRTGILIGLTLAALAFPAITWVMSDVRLAAAVSLSIIAAGSVATTVGLLLPWLFQRMGSDPAFGAGPIATILQDVLSLLIYFSLATWLAAP